MSSKCRLDLGILKNTQEVFVCLDLRPMNRQIFRWGKINLDYFRVGGGCEVQITMDTIFSYLALYENLGNCYGKNVQGQLGGASSKFSVDSWTSNITFLGLFIKVGINGIKISSHHLERIPMIKRLEIISTNGKTTIDMKTRAGLDATKRPFWLIMWYENTVTSPVPTPSFQQVFSWHVSVSEIWWQSLILIC